MMEGIGGSIVKGATGALWTMLMAVPLPVWLILFFGLVVFGVLIRYLTDVKVDAAIACGVALFCIVVYYREHWIEMGYAQAQAQVKAAQAEMAGYKSTEKLVQDCYAKNMSVPYLWDRTQGKCLRASGAIEH